MNNQTPLAANLTGELFLPVRLFYRIHTMKTVLQAFKKMTCMQFNAANDRWEWLYYGEAKALEFEKPYSSIPMEKRPIILGLFSFKGVNEMHLDIGSCERAIEAVAFFDKRIHKTACELTDAAIYNRLIPPAERSGTNFDALFAEVTSEAIQAKQDALEARIREFAKSDNLRELLEERRFDLVEGFPANFYAEGLNRLQSMLMMRQIVLLRRRNGQKDYCVTDYILEAMAGLKA